MGGSEFWILILEERKEGVLGLEEGYISVRDEKSDFFFFFFKKVWAS